MKNNGATISGVDRILLQGMVFSGRHGVTDAERARSQRFTKSVIQPRELGFASEARSAGVESMPVHAGGLPDARQEKCEASAS